jgi:DNA replication protein DnaC
MIDQDLEIKLVSKILGLNIFVKYEDYYDSNDPFTENLLRLLNAQKADNNLKRIERGIKKAGFPILKTKDAFDFEKLNCPNLNIDVVKNTFDCAFIAEKHDIVIMGPPGQGKTHLAIAIGIEAIRSNFQVRFFKTGDLIVKLKEAKTKKSLLRTTKEISNIDLLIIDEFGYIDYIKEDIDLLFNILSSRNERKSTIITTNKPFSTWDSFIIEPSLANAIVDRLTFRTILFDMNGPKSYRRNNSLIPVKKK